MLIKVLKITFYASLLSVLTSCADSTRFAIAGYIPPPPETTVSEELQLEYDRCKKIGVENNCAQAAYDVVRVVKGLEPRPIPKGYVIILEGDGGHLSEPVSEEKKEDNRE